MSNGTSPIHRFSGNYDGYYDADFTADISSKMQVPERISATSDPRDLGTYRQDEPGKLMMHVPDRILLQGGDLHIADRDCLPELRLESSLSEQPYQRVQLTTPPHVITLDNHHFPTIEEDHEFLQAKENSNRQLPLTTDMHNDDSMMNLSSPPGFQADDELILLRRQMRSLTRRVLLIQQDNQQRQQREIVLYSAGVVYFLFKGLIWLHRHW